MSHNIHVEVNPIITTTSRAESTSESTSENNVTIEITNNINGLQGLLSELKEEIAGAMPDYMEEYEKIQNAIAKLESLKTKEEFTKSGLLNKLKRFIDDCGDPNTTIGKTIRGVKQGWSILQDVAEKYNFIAQWCGLPCVPKLFLKK